VFEHIGECSKIEWSIEESEKRLNEFADKVSQLWLSDKKRSNQNGGPKESVTKFKDKQSAEALQIFVNLNFLILDVRKVLSFTLLSCLIPISPRYSKRILKLFRSS
jgi:hypothetical protein